MAAFSVSCSSVVGDHEVCQLPGVLIGLDLDLLLLLVYRQFACWQHGAGPLAVGREVQLDRADAVIPRTGSVIELAEGKVAIGDETEPAPVLGGQFDDVLDIVAYTATCESDTPLGLHVLEYTYKAILARAFEGVDECFLVRGGGVPVDVNINIVDTAELGACSSGGRLDCHWPLSLDEWADGHQQQKKGAHKALAAKPVSISHAALLSPPGVLDCGTQIMTVRLGQTIVQSPHVEPRDVSPPSELAITTGLTLSARRDFIDNVRTCL